MRVKGLITDIQRFSLNDGDGIRTTVFFKGCNMRCAWCHNPETIRRNKQLYFYDNKCIGCRECFSVCPTGAHRIENGAHIVDREKCIACGACADVCYADALVLCGKEVTVEEIMAEIRQDKEYYKTSGGGVTLSGGEVLCQKAFALSLIAACHDEGIPIAIESNVNFDYASIREVLTAVDFVMCDLKIFDEEKHRQYTGTGNENVKNNLLRMEADGVDFIVRTPLIPGATDDDENINEIAGFLKPLKHLRLYELLNFNPLGEAKYRGLSEENVFQNEKPLPEERLAELRGLLETAGLPFHIR